MLGIQGPAYSLVADGKGLITQGRRAWVFDNQRLLSARRDGEPGNPTPVRTASSRTLPRLQVQRNARIIQVRDLTFLPLQPG